MAWRFIGGIGSKTMRRVFQSVSVVPRVVCEPGPRFRSVIASSWRCTRCRVLLTIAERFSIGDTWMNLSEAERESIALGSAMNSFTRIPCGTTIGHSAGAGGPMLVRMGRVVKLPPGKRAFAAARALGPFVDDGSVG